MRKFACQPGALLRSSKHSAQMLLEPLDVRLRRIHGSILEFLISQPCVTQRCQYAQIPRSINCLGFLGACKSRWDYRQQIGSFCMLARSFRRFYFDPSAFLRCYRLCILSLIAITHDRRLHSGLYLQGNHFQINFSCLQQIGQYLPVIPRQVASCCQLTGMRFHGL